jgi:hypothetical protein
MAGFRDALIDGLALMLVGGGLATAAVSYARSIPDPAVRVARSLPAWEDPVTTGSIGPRVEEADPARPDPWTDPPPRASGPGDREPF